MAYMVINLIKLIIILSIFMENAEISYALYTIRYPLSNTLRPMAAALSYKDPTFTESRNIKSGGLAAEMLNLGQIPPVVLDANFVYNAFSVDRSNIHALGEGSSYVPIRIEGYSAEDKGALTLLIYKGYPVAVLRENKIGLETQYKFSIGFLTKDFKIEKSPACQWIRDNFLPLIKDAENTDINVKGLWDTEHKISVGIDEKTQRQYYGLPFIQYFKGVFAQGLNSSIPMMNIVKSEAQNGIRARRVLDIACGAGGLSLAAVENFRAESVVTVDSDVFALLSTMINFERLGRRRALTVVYGCLKEQATWDILISKGLYDYVLFNGPFPVSESHAGARDHIMYDETGRVKTKLIENIHALVSKDGIAQILSDEDFGTQIKNQGFVIGHLETNAEGLHFYVIMPRSIVKTSKVETWEQVVGIARRAPKVNYNDALASSQPRLFRGVRESGFFAAMETKKVQTQPYDGKPTSWGSADIVIGTACTFDKGMHPVFKPGTVAVLFEIMQDTAKKYNIEASYGLGNTWRAIPLTEIIRIWAVSVDSEHDFRNNIVRLAQISLPGIGQALQVKGESDVDNIRRILTENTDLFQRVAGLLQEMHTERIITRCYITGSFARGELKNPPKDIDIALSVRTGILYWQVIGDYLSLIEKISEEFGINIHITIDAFGPVYRITEGGIELTGEVRGEELISDHDRVIGNKLIELHPHLDAMISDSTFTPELYKKVANFCQHKAADSELDISRSLRPYTALELPRNMIKNMEDNAVGSPASDGINPKVVPISKPPLAFTAIDSAA